ncbi:DUF2461 domain-containing protein [Prolixibacteraceae bacterium JC049]|nr:DUF2461 domain-containing protein [Prolixibacteraceae bacterium JC049]
MQKVQQFLTDLTKNNNKEWFQANKGQYQDARNQFLAFTEILINEIRSFDPSVPMQDPSKCVFRIYRDVRFSHDKRPYKTNFGAFISRGGRKSGYAGYYFHAEPDASFMGGGVYCPPPANLKAIRSEIYESPQEFIDLVSDKNFSKYYPELYSEDKLKTAPKGFPKDWEHIDLLRYKHYVVAKKMTDKELVSPDLIEESINAYRALYDFNSYLNECIDRHQ